MRFATARSDKAQSPAMSAGPSVTSIPSPRAATSVPRAASTSRVTAARSSGSRRAIPRWPRASMSSASISRSCSAPAARTRSHAVRSDSDEAAGSRSATSSSVRERASGVRSSCEALATNWRWASNDMSRRANRPSIVSASSRRSSSGPSSASRSCRFVAEILRAAAVIRRSGRSARPAANQPSATDTTAMIPSAMPEYSSRALVTAVRARVAACSAWVCSGWEAGRVTEPAAPEPAAPAPAAPEPAAPEPAAPEPATPAPAALAMTTSPVALLTSP